MKKETEVSKLKGNGYLETYILHIETEDGLWVHGELNFKAGYPGIENLENDLNRGLKRLINQLRKKNHGHQTNNKQAQEAT